MKLVQFWRNGAPALGLQTEAGIVDAAAEATRRGTTAPADMEEAILLGAEGAEGAEGVEQLLDPLTRDPVCLLPPEAVRLAPVVTAPGRILCIGLNYRQHARECDLPLPPAPVLFNKFHNALAAHGEAIALPADYREYDYEAELVAVIGKPARDVPQERALD